MAHTDVHRPGWVQKADPESRHLFKRFQMWADRPPVLWPLINLCGCHGCTGQGWRKHKRRQERARGKRECRRLEE